MDFLSRMWISDIYYAQHSYKILTQILDKFAKFRKIVSYNSCS